MSSFLVCSSRFTSGRKSQPLLRVPHCVIFTQLASEGLQTLLGGELRGGGDVTQLTSRAEGQEVLISGSSGVYQPVKLLICKILCICTYLMYLHAYACKRVHVCRCFAGDSIPGFPLASQRCL